MKRTLFIVAAFALLGTAPSICFGQTRPAPQRPAAPATAVAVPDTKIAIIDTARFAEEKTGIKRYLNAVKSVQGEFAGKQKELVDLQTRLKAISDDVAKLSGNSVVSPETIRAKQDEYERLQRDLKYKKEQAEAEFQKRFETVVGPISEDIGKALNQYATDHGLSMILDISKLLPAVLTMNPAMDVTQAFISEYNSKNP